MWHPCRRSLIVLSAFACGCAALRASEGSDGLRFQRVAAAFLLALGRMPTAEEQARAVQEDSLTVADTIARLRQQIESDDAVRADVLARAARDALGRLPTDDEIAAWSGEPRGATYAERMERRLAWLAERPAEYERVIQRAYRVVVRRDAYPEEIEYWRARGTLS